MIKANGLHNKLLIILLLLIGLVSCQKDTFDIEKNNDVFFDFLIKYNHTEEIDITELGLYYYDQDYYYDVSYYVENDDFHYRHLIVIHIDYIKYCASFVDIENNTQLQELYSDCGYYTDYLYVKENGLSKIYTDEEIDTLIEKYCK